RDGNPYILPSGQVNRMDAASAFSGGSRMIRKFPASGFETSKSEKGHPYGRGGCRLRSRWSGAHVEGANRAASGLDVSVNPGWRLAASEIPELAIRQSSLWSPESDWDDSDGPKSCQEKNETNCTKC